MYGLYNGNTVFFLNDEDTVFVYVVVSWLLTNSLNHLRIQTDTDEIVHKYIYLPSDFYSENTLISVNVMEDALMIYWH